MVELMVKVVALLMLMVMVVMVMVMVVVMVRSIAGESTVGPRLDPTGAD